MDRFFLTLDATKYLANQGISLSSEGLRKTEERGEIRPARTESGSRLYEQSLLDEFVVKRKTKNLATQTKQFKAA